jgi:hypothetical protein
VVQYVLFGAVIAVLSLGVEEKKKRKKYKNQKKPNCPNANISFGILGIF